MKYRWQMIPLWIALILYAIISGILQSDQSPRVICHEVAAAIILILLELVNADAPISPVNNESQKTCEMLLNNLPDLITVVSDTTEVIFANKAYQQLAKDLEHNSNNLELLSQITDLQFKEDKGPLIELLRNESQSSDSKSHILDINDEIAVMKTPKKGNDVATWRGAHNDLDTKMEAETPLPRLPKKSKNKTLILKCDLASAIMIVIHNFQQFEASIGDGLSILYGKLHRENGIGNTYEIKLSCPRIMNKKVLLVSLSETAHRDKVFKLEEISRFKSGLLGAFSHELRTPLNANLNFLTAAAQDNQIPMELRDKLITPALKNAELLMYLVCDILDFSQMSTNTLTLNFSKQSLQQLMNDLIFMFNIQSKQKKVTINFEIDKEVPREVRTDFQRLKQVLINLLRYALNHTFDGNILIKVSAYGVLAKVFRISVQDTGIGLSEDEQAKLLDFLYDGPNDDGYEKVPRESVSLTLGLKIASKLSELLCPAKKGGLRFQSTYNSGSAFYFYIEDLMGESDYLDINIPSIRDYLKKSIFAPDLRPIPEVLKGSTFNETMSPNVSCSDIDISAVPIPNFQAHSATNYKTAATTNHRPLTFSQFDKKNKSVIKEEPPNVFTHRIPIIITPDDIKDTLDKNVCECKEALIVDDDAFNILSLGALLNKLGINYEEAFDGQLAIDKIVGKKRCCERCRLYSIIFMDCNMPVKDGYEASAELKEMMNRKILPFIPIVACTAYVIDYQATKCKDIGMDEYITKPVNQKMLLDVLKKWGLM